MTSYSPILAIGEIGPTQNNKATTHNNSIKYFEQATQRRLVKTGSYTSNEWLPTEPEFTRYFYFKASGLGAASNFVCPAISVVTTAERVFVVFNADTTYALTVKGPSAGTTVVLPPGWVGFCYRNGNDIEGLLLFKASTSTASVYDVGGFVPGAPDDGATVFIHAAARAISFPANFGASKGKCLTNPTSTAAFDVKKNGSSIGTISINTSGVFTFTTSGGTAQSLAVGDVLTVIAPSPADATLADVAYTLIATIVP